MHKCCDTEKEKDSTYILRIISENFDAFATLSHSLQICNTSVTNVKREEVYSTIQGRSSVFMYMNAWNTIEVYRNSR